MSRLDRSGEIMDELARRGVAGTLDMHGLAILEVGGPTRITLATGLSGWDFAQGSRVIDGESFPDERLDVELDIVEDTEEPARIAALWRLEIDRIRREEGI